METQNQISYFEMAPRGRPTEKNILLLHGWGAHKEKLKPLAEKLKANGWYVVAVDLPGFGQTPPPKRVFSVKDYAKVINEFTEKKFDNNGFFVFGHSFGGRIAVNLTIMNPNINGTILCATSGLVRPHIVKRIIFLILAKIGKVFLAIPGMDFIAELWKRFLYKAAREHDYEKTHGIMRYVFRNIVADGIRPLLPNLQVPVLLLWGTVDKQTPLKSAYLAKSLINRPMLKVFTDVGHALPYKRPAELARQITIWSKTFLS